MLGEGCCGSGGGAPELGEDVEGGHHGSLCEGPAHFGGCSPQRLISNGAQLGNRRPFVGLQGSPGTGPALQWNIWKALAPPGAKAAEPWRQRSMTPSWLLLNPCPRQVLFWEPVSNSDLWCQGLCAAAVTFTFDKRVGAEKGSGEGEQWEFGFSGNQNPSGEPCFLLTGFLAGKAASWAIAWC